MIYLRPHSTIRSLNLNSIASGSTWTYRWLYSKKKLCQFYLATHPLVQPKTSCKVACATHQHLVAANAQGIQREKVFRGISEEIFLANGIYVFRCENKDVQGSGWIHTNETLPEELEKFVCIGISKIMGDYSIHWNVRIEKAIERVWCMYQHIHQCCPGESQDGMLDHGGLAGHKIWVEKLEEILKISDYL